MEDPVLPGNEHRLDIRFVGSGSEYFRIWIVNLLLTLVTLGIYYPFAKVRKQRYFHGATEVGGHPLSYHADPWKVLRGYALVAGAAVAYSATARFFPLAAIVLLVLFAAAWPALWHSSLRFRLANTGWRGLRLRFLGSRQGAYAAAVPGLVLFVGLASVGLLIQNAEAAGEGDEALAATVSGLAGVLTLALFAAFPALLWRLRRYQHAHYGLAGEQTRFSVPVSAFYGLSFRAGFVALGTSLLVGVVLGVLMWSVGRPAGGEDSRARIIVLSLVPVVVMWLVYFGVLGPYMTSRLQNLVWNGTRSAHLRFESSLRFSTLLGLSLRNTLLVVCTLGLYFPFAAIATARLRLQAVTVNASVDPGTLVSASAPQEASALGDAAGDVAGIDLGL